MNDEQAWESPELLGVYRIAVEEYRFQVKLNWNRTQYLFALNAAVLAIGASLASIEASRQAGSLVATVFGMGILTSLHAIAITSRQHQYYRNARDHMQHVASRIGLGELRLQTTAGMRNERAGKRTRVGRVTWMHYGLFSVFVLMHGAGVVHAVT